MKVLAQHRRARFDYELAERFTAGIALTGSEVKSVKAGHASLKGAFITMRDGEAWLNNAHVTPYQPGGQSKTPDPARTRKLLLHRKQLEHFIEERRHGHVIVPTALVLQGKLVKLELALGTSKKNYDKRETMKRRDASREARREIAKFSRKSA